MPEVTPQKRVKLAHLFGLLGFALAVWLIYWAAIYRLIPAEPAGARGLFGDSFGAANALFSAFAFAGLIYTILLQREELALQRQELSDTREVLKGQEQQLKDQNTTLRLQSFENTFFQLLRLHSDITNSLRVQIGSSRCEGRAAFQAAVDRMEQQYVNELTQQRSETEHLREIDQMYEHVFQNPQGDFGHYSRNLYRIMKFIDESDITQRKRYTSLVRAQLSRPELLCLFYNCLANIGRQKFKALVEKYALLENMNPSFVMMEHLKIYDERAFGDHDRAA